jgi:hypothetical protein
MNSFASERSNTLWRVEGKKPQTSYFKQVSPGLRSLRQIYTEYSITMTSETCQNVQTVFSPKCHTTEIWMWKDVYQSLWFCTSSVAAVQTSLPRACKVFVFIHCTYRHLKSTLTRFHKRIIFPYISNIIFKHPVIFIYLPRTIYSVLNATTFTFVSPPYGMFRPQTAIIRCFVYAKTVALHAMYKMFTYTRADVMFLV